MNKIENGVENTQYICIGLKLLILGGFQFQNVDVFPYSRKYFQ